jgi:hypothetical protein
MSICTSWIDHIDFLHFWPSKIHVSPTDVVSSLFPPRYRLSFSRRRHAAASCHAFFPLSQGKLATSVSSFGNILSRCLPSRVETEALNLHHRCRLPSLDRSTPTLHYYKNIISTLATLSTTQLHFYFASSLARALSHWSFTHRHCFLSLLSHAHHPFAQWHLQWWTSRLCFASRTAYQNVNSRKNIFWNVTALREVIN